MSREDLNATSYAVLGLLSLRRWPAYELAAEMQHCFAPYWPRAQSRTYEQAERLVAAGLAEESKEMKGRRRRTTYAITDAGRQALHRWLSQPSAMFTLEFEGMIKVFLAGAGDKDQLVANLLQIERTADMLLAVAEQRRRFCVDGQDPWLANEGHIRALVADFLVDYFTVVRGWARRTRERVHEWEDLSPRNDAIDIWKSLRIEPSSEAKPEM